QCVRMSQPTPDSSTKLLQCAALCFAVSSARCLTFVRHDSAFRGFVVTQSPCHPVTLSPGHLVVGERHAAVALGRVWLVVFVARLWRGVITGAVLRLTLLRQQHLHTLEQGRAGLR